MKKNTPKKGSSSTLATQVNALNSMMSGATSHLSSVQSSLDKLLDIYTRAEQELKDINRSIGNEDGNLAADLRKLQSMMSMNARTAKALSVNASRFLSVRNMNVIVS